MDAASAAFGFLSANLRPCLDVVSSTFQDTARRFLPDIGAGEQVVIGDRQFRLLRLVRASPYGILAC